MKYCKTKILKADLNLGQSMQRPRMGGTVGNVGFCVS